MKTFEYRHPDDDSRNIVVSFPDEVIPPSHLDTVDLAGGAPQTLWIWRRAAALPVERTGSGYPLAEGEERTWGAGRDKENIPEFPAEGVCGGVVDREDNRGGRAWGPN